jgi:hypothetical protein
VQNVLGIAREVAGVPQQEGLQSGDPQARARFSADRL